MLLLWSDAKWQVMEQGGWCSTSLQLQVANRTNLAEKGMGHQEVMAAQAKEGRAEAEGDPLHRHQVMAAGASRREAISQEHRQRAESVISWSRGWQWRILL